MADERVTVRIVDGRQQTPDPAIAVMQRANRRRLAEQTYGLCSQCGERPTAMVEIDTAAGWCITCVVETRSGS